MRVLHTSDWHLGKTLYGRKRYEEFSKFLNWLKDTVVEYGIDLLLVAGDVFDSTIPSHKARELYYHFLYEISRTNCQHVVITGGNHDSSSLLNAPKELLKSFNIHVLGSITSNMEDEIIVLNDKKGLEMAVICAVPYLRDRDVRKVDAGEEIADKTSKLIHGIKEHYEKVFQIAKRKRKEGVPLIAMGHMFTTGGIALEGDGTRELYVGSLARIDADIFSSKIDYLALGHLHQPQKVNKKENMRYSGSPLPMGFGESSKKKSVVFIETKYEKEEINTKVELIFVPVFQKLVRIEGNMDELIRKINVLKDEKSSAWLEIFYNGKSSPSNIKEKLEHAIEGTNMEIRRIKNIYILKKALIRTDEKETLDELDETGVFNRCLDDNGVKGDIREELNYLYQKVLLSLKEEDANKE